MSNCFVYKWINRENGKIYIGMKKGSPNEPYVCSSVNIEFHRDFINGLLDRTIVETGLTVEEALRTEYTIWRNIKRKTPDLLYNKIMRNPYANAFNADGSIKVFKKSQRIGGEEKRRSIWKLKMSIAKKLAARDPNPELEARLNA